MTVHHRLNQGGAEDDSTGADFSNVERQIANLRDAITSKGSHRSQVLEQASESTVQIQKKWRSAQITIGLSIVLVIVSPLIGALTRIEVPGPQTAAQTNEAALQRAKSGRMSFDWALVDLFSHFREQKQSR